MAQRNEPVTVYRLDKDGDLDWVTYRACGWDTVQRGDGIALVVHAWRGGLRTEVAEYSPGQWAYVTRDRVVAQ